METYLGVKKVKAKEMTRQEYYDYRGWKLPDNEDGNEVIYLVEYEADDKSKPNHSNHEGYITMSPKHVFDKAYHKITGLTFGLAIEAIKLGKAVARKGWNGKGMFIYYVPAAKYKAMTSIAQSIGDWVDYNAYIAIKNVDNTISTWVPSVNDCLSEDWYIVR